MLPEGPSVLGHRRSGSPRESQSGCLGVWGRCLFIHWCKAANRAASGSVGEAGAPPEMYRFFQGFCVYW